MDTGTLNNIIGIISGCVALWVTSWGLRAFIEHRLVEPRDTRFVDAIENQSTYKLYRYFVKELLLEPLTRFVGDRDTGQWWSARLFDRVLLLAFIYPVGAAFCSWMLSGDAGPAGVALGLSPDTPAWQRALMGGLLLPIPILYPFLRGSLAVAVAGALAVTGAFAGAFAGAGDVAFAGALAGALAVTGAVAGAGAVAFAGAFAVALAGPVAVAFAVAGAFAVVFAVAVNRRWLYSSLWLGLCAAVVRIAGLIDMSERSQTWLVYLAAIPLVNSLFDFVSVGMTRKLLHFSLKAETIWKRIQWSLLDVAVAAITMVSLIFCLTLYLEILNRIGPQELLPLAPIHASIKANPWDAAHYWVYFTLLSTFIPTLIHLTTAGMALVVAAPYGIIDHHREAAQLRRDDLQPFDTWVLSARLTVAALAGLVMLLVAIFGLYVLLSQVFPYGAYRLLWISELGMAAARRVIATP